MNESTFKAFTRPFVSFTHPILKPLSKLKIQDHEVLINDTPGIELLIRSVYSIFPHTNLTMFLFWPHFGSLLIKNISSHNDPFDVLPPRKTEKLTIIKFSMYIVSSKVTLKFCPSITLLQKRNQNDSDTFYCISHLLCYKEIICCYIIATSRSTVTDFESRSGSELHYELKSNSHGKIIS